MNPVPRVYPKFTCFGVGRCSGVTVIEILVGMVISMFILGGIVAVMYNSRTNHEISQMKSNVQENGRFAMHFLTEDIRLAGFFGCNNSIQGGNNFSGRMTGTDGDSGSTDAITIRYANPEDFGVVTGTAIPGESALANYSITVGVANDYCSSTPCDLADVGGWDDDPFEAVISDCGGSAIVTVSEVDTGANTMKITSSSALGRGIFDAGATIKRIVTANYVIQNGANGLPALWRNGVEMVEGVDNTQFLYRTTSGNQTAVPDWATLRAVQMEVLARSISSENAASGSSRQYGIDRDSGARSMLGTTVAAGEIQGTRQSYASLVTRRNN